jgi:alginate O-acetyltransferase complex protein AlgJ
MTTRQQLDLPPVHEAWLPREHTLYRPRHSRRQWVALISAAVFFATPLVSLVLGVRPGEFENRPLAAFPSPGEGWGFFTGMPPWANDHLVFREDAIHFADWISGTLFGEPPALGEATGNAAGPVQEDKQKAPIPSSFPKVVHGKNGWLYLGDDVESHCVRSDPTEVTVSRLRRLRDAVESSGRKFVVIVAPDKATMAQANLPDEYIGKACHTEASNEFWRRVSAENYVIDLRGSLREWAAQTGAPVYGPQDAHWSDEGGVAMAGALAERLRPGIRSTWKIAPSTPWKVAADIPALIGRSGVTEGRFYSIMPDGRNDRTRQKVGDFTEPLRLTTASGTGTYGLSVGLLSDSFTYRALPYLSAAFGDMTIWHHNSIVQDEGRSTAKMLADNSVVAIEVVERTLVAGPRRFGLLSPPVLDNVIAEMSQRPIR